MKIFQSISENIVKSGPPTKEDSHYESGTVWYDHKNGRIYYFFIIEDSSDWYRDWETDRKSTRLNSSHSRASRMPSSA